MIILVAPIWRAFFSTSAKSVLLANIGEVADDLVVLLEQPRQDGARVETAGNWPSRPLPLLPVMMTKFVCFLGKTGEGSLRALGVDVEVN